eukprot:4414433-Amphidinium_carterae.1
MNFDDLEFKLRPVCCGIELRLSGKEDGHIWEEPSPIGQWQLASHLRNSWLAPDADVGARQQTLWASPSPLTKVSGSSMAEESSLLQRFSHIIEIALIFYFVSNTTRSSNPRRLKHQL